MYRPVPGGGGEMIDRIGIAILADTTTLIGFDFIRRFSEALIAFACLTLTYQLGKLVRDRPDLPVGRFIRALLALLIAFAFFQLAEAFLLAKQSSWFAVAIESITALCAWTAVVVLGRIIPQTREMKSRPELQREIELRMEALNKLNIELRQSESRFRSVVEAVPNGIVMVDGSGAIVLVNALTERLFGYNRNELIGEKVETLLPIEARERHPFDRENYFKAPLPRAMGVGRELRGRRKDGTEFPVEIGLSPLSTSDGVLVLASIVDISKRKEVEEQINLSRNMMRLVIDNIPQGVFWKDTESRYLGCNRVVAQSVGFASSDEILGKTDFEIPSITPEQANFFVQKDRETMARDESTLDIVEQMTLIDGRTVWLSTNKVPMHDEKGRVIGLLGTWQDITDRKRVEEEQRKLKSLIEHSRDFIAVSDLDGRITFMNRGAKKMIGLEENDDATRLNIRDYIPPQWHDFLKDTVLPSASKTGLWEGEMQLQHLRTGSLIDVQRSTFLIRGADNDPGFFATVTRDITEEKRAQAEIRRLNVDLERRVRERTADFEEAQRLARVGSWVWHLDSDRIEWSNELYRLLGFDPSLPAPTFEAQSAIFSPESWKTLNEIVANSRMTGQSFVVELQYRRPGGDYGMIRSAGEVERDVAGNIIRLRGTAQDITELRRTEEELRKVTERLTLATEAGRVGIWDWDVQANILTWDRMMYQLYGITEDQFGGAYDAWQAGVHPEDRIRGDLEIQMALAGEKDFNTEFRVSWPNGSVHMIRAHAIVRRDGSGKPIRMIGTNWDITEIKEAEEAITALNETLKKRAAEIGEANRELEAFSYSVSHDLRAPLRGIDGFSRILMEDYADQMPAEAREYLSDVRKGTQQMGHLVDDLLNFSRLSRQKPRKIDIDVEGMVKQCLEEINNRNENRRIEFVVGDLRRCHADPSLLRQVWVNLLENAVKYTGKREFARVEIGSRIESDGSTLYFVRDNGVGFDMRFAQKLFGVFQRLHRSEDYEGTGVGLAIVQRIVGRHGGRVGAHSEPDRGAEFYFTMPSD